MIGPSAVRGGWGPRTAGLVLLVLVVPQLAVAMATPELRSTAALAGVATTMTYLAVLCAAILGYFHWRLTGADYSAWLSALCAVVGFHGLVVMFLYVSRPAEASDHPAWLVGSDAGAGLLVLAAVLASRRFTMSRHPARVALLAGTAGSLLLLAVADLTPSDPLPASTHVVVTWVLLAVGAATSVLVWRCTAVPRWVRQSTALACFLLLANRAIFCPASGNDAGHVLAILTGVAGSTVLCTTVSALVRDALREEREAILALRSQVDAVRAAAEAAEDRLHEVRGSVAGIASACHLINVADRMPAARRHALAEMLDAESHRLQRMMHGATTADQVEPDPTPAYEEPGGPMLDELLPITQPAREVRVESTGPREVDLDTLLHPLVLARRVSGHRVSWAPSGLRACCRPDDLATVVSILLDNAAKHAPGSRVTVSAALTPSEVQVRVEDRGPGIDESVRDLLFDRGRKGSGSPGSGIGMHMAAQLARASGSTLELESTGPGGTTFVVRIRRTGHGEPRAESGDADASGDRVLAPALEPGYEAGPMTTARGTSSSSSLSYAV